MPTYLERYRQGEHSQVWNELVAQGDAVRREPLLNDAASVAQETMRRARHNIELLVGRLQQIGFRFHDPRHMYVPATAQMLRDLKQFEQEAGPVPLSVRALVEVVGDVNFMGSHPRLSYYAPLHNPFFAVGGPGGQTQQMDLGQLLQSANLGALFGGKPAPQGEQDNFQTSISTLQGALQKLIGMGAATGKQAAMPDLPPDEQTVSDPLVVELGELSLDAYEEWQSYGDETGPFALVIAPDILHKANISGSDGYEIHLPNAAADAPLLNTEWGSLTFVEYLRLSFAWAGFPGLQTYEQRDDALLTWLKDGLLPL